MRSGRFIFLREDDVRNCVIVRKIVKRQNLSLSCYCYAKTYSFCWLVGYAAYIIDCWGVGFRYIYIVCGQLFFNARQFIREFSAFYSFYFM